MNEVLLLISSSFLGNLIALVLIAGLLRLEEYLLNKKKQKTLKDTKEFLDRYTTRMFSGEFTEKFERNSN